ncbi:MAG: diguanylate cyclase [Planctomycetales bacterium]|nr:diguanylate cyclase [Planctomycetales bacterium]
MRLPFRFNIPIVARITLGLVGLVVSSLMIISLLGFFPDSRQEQLERRKQFGETAAIGFSLMADKADIVTMRKYLETLSTRCDDLVSLGVRRDDGSLVVECGNHDDRWRSQGKMADDSHVWVRFYAHGEPWGTFEAAFQPLDESGGILRRAEIKHGLVASLFCLCGFYLYLKYTLRQLDPSSVVPNRVREALDTLAEGLVILDLNERAVLANRAFEMEVGSTAKQIIGKPLDRLPLISRDETPSPRTPWREALQSGQKVTGRLLGTNRKGAPSRTFSVSASPIVDEQGARRGILVSFEDVTRLEEKKRELSGMVEVLRASSEAIKQQNRELERLATRDPLTGSLNRRSFFERFESEWNIAKRYERPLSVMMVDVDFFKSINDTYGHGMGDEVLRQVASTLQSTAREADIVCRYGGEEFAVLLPMTTIDEAASAAERMRVALERLKFPNFTITASLGVAMCSADLEQPQESLDRADKCLYVAKRSGRNQVVRWDQVPEDLVVDESKVSRTKEVPEPDAVSVPYHAVTALISALAYRDQRTAAHCRRVADLCVFTAEGLLSLKECYTLEVAALLHDIGKIGVPDSILLKPGALTDEEWQVMRRNDTIGKEIIRASFASPKLTAIVSNYQMHYAGAPDRAGAPIGNELPLGARILAIADAYDAMTTDQVFREGCTPSEAFAELRRCAGTQFDPELVERFITTMGTRPAAMDVELADIAKETALQIGLQIERLSDVLDEQDFESLEAISRRLHLSASQHGAEAISNKALELQAVLEHDRDPHSILLVANELLDLCRSTQRSFLAAQCPAELQTDVVC